MSKVEKLLRPEIETFRFDLRLQNELDPINWSIFGEIQRVLIGQLSSAIVPCGERWVIFTDELGHDIQLVICILYIEYILNDSQMFKKKIQNLIFSKIENFHTVF